MLRKKNKQFNRMKKEYTYIHTEYCGKVIYWNINCRSNSWKDYEFRTIFDKNGNCVIRCGNFEEREQNIWTKK